jgi:hypothetical protein
MDAVYFCWQLSTMCLYLLTRGRSHFRCLIDVVVGRDSSVGIATRYELDGPGIESRWGRDFQNPFRPALGPTQPPVQWVPGHSRG